MLDAASLYNYERSELPDFHEFRATPENVLKDGCLLITGGTGSFGHAVLDRFLSSGLREIRIFSRDEKKQHDMRLRYANPKLKFYLGDVRDYQSMLGAMQDVDFVFHAAALKQVPSCEFYPMEAVKTNVLGTECMLNAALACRVRRVICLSTDKAVYPVSAMGISKALMEKVALAKARAMDQGVTRICTTRYGNVMASRGSVIPLFVEQILSGHPLTITDPAMTRFMMTLEEAVELVMYAFVHGDNGDTFVQKAPATSIGTLARAICELLGVPNHPIDIIGTRHGEKRSEALLSREEMAMASDLGAYYRVKPDSRDLNYAKFFEEGATALSQAEDYNSDNTEQLDLQQTKRMLGRLPYLKEVLAGRVHELAA
jgi:UDP-N-acetylglucosamine 4,6-dehydratase